MKYEFLGLSIKSDDIPVLSNEELLEKLIWLVEIMEIASSDDEESHKIMMKKVRSEILQRMKSE